MVQQSRFPHVSTSYDAALRLCVPASEDHMLLRFLVAWLRVLLAKGVRVRFV